MSTLICWLMTYFRLFLATVCVVSHTLFLSPDITLWVTSAACSFISDYCHLGQDEILPIWMISGLCYWIPITGEASIVWSWDSRLCMFMYVGGRCLYMCCTWFLAAGAHIFEDQSSHSSFIPLVTHTLSLELGSLNGLEVPIWARLFGRGRWSGISSLTEELPLPYLCFDWLNLVQVLCMLSQLVWIHICNGHVTSRKYGAGSGSQNILPCNDYCVLGWRSVTEMSHVRLRTPYSLILCTLTNCGSVLMSIRFMASVIVPSLSSILWNRPIRKSLVSLISIMPLLNKCPCLSRLSLL